MNTDFPVVTPAPSVIVTVAVGLVIAFAVQLLLTSFGIAAGVTTVGSLSRRRSSDIPTAQNRSIGHIGIAVGLGTLLTVNTVLFIACFLAVKLSLVSSVAVGAILGVVIWSGYILLVVWLSSTAIGSVLNLVLGGLTAGLQGLKSTISTALNWKKSDPLSPESLQHQLEETQSALSSLQQDLEQRDLKMQEALQALQAPKVDLQAIRDEFAQVLRAAQAHRGGNLPEAEQIDRNTLLELVSSRADFSNLDVQQIVEQLESVWQAVVKTRNSITVGGEQGGLSDRQAAVTAQVTEYLLTAKKSDLKPARLHHQLKLALQAAGFSTAQWSSGLDGLSQHQLEQTLSQRSNLSRKERQRKVRQLRTLIDQLLTESVEQQEQAQPIATALGQFRQYLLALNVPTVSNEPIKQELQQLVASLQTNLDTLDTPLLQHLRHRLPQLNREVVTTLLQTQEGVSEAIAHQLTEYITAARLAIQQNLEQLQQEATHQVSELKQQAQHRAELARKTVMSAAWWLFCIAFTSIASSAIAGALAVRGFLD